MATFADGDIHQIIYCAHGCDVGHTRQRRVITPWGYFLRISSAVLPEKNEQNRRGLRKLISGDRSLSAISDMLHVIRMCKYVITEWKWMT